MAVINFVSLCFLGIITLAAVDASTTPDYFYGGFDSYQLGVGPTNGQDLPAVDVGVKIAPQVTTTTTATTSASQLPMDHLNNLLFARMMQQIKTRLLSDQGGEGGAGGGEGGAGGGKGGAGGGERTAAGGEGGTGGGEEGAAGGEGVAAGGEGGAGGGEGGTGGQGTPAESSEESPKDPGFSVNGMNAFLGLGTNSGSEYSQAAPHSVGNQMKQMDQGFSTDSNRWQTGGEFPFSSLLSLADFNGRTSQGLSTGNMQVPVGQKLQVGRMNVPAGQVSYSGDMQASMQNPSNGTTQAQAGAGISAGGEGGAGGGGGVAGGEGGAAGEEGGAAAGEGGVAGGEGSTAGGEGGAAGGEGGVAGGEGGAAGGEGGAAGESSEESPGSLAGGENALAGLGQSNGGEEAQAGQELSSGGEEAQTGQAALAGGEEAIGGQLSLTGGEEAAGGQASSAGGEGATAENELAASVIKTNATQGSTATVQVVQTSTGISTDGVRRGPAQMKSAVDATGVTNVPVKLYLEGLISQGTASQGPSSAGIPIPFGMQGTSSSIGNVGAEDGSETEGTGSVAVSSGAASSQSARDEEAAFSNRSKEERSQTSQRSSTNVQSSAASRNSSSNQASVSSGTQPSNAGAGSFSRVQGTASMANQGRSSVSGGRSWGSKKTFSASTRVNVGVQRPMVVGGKSSWKFQRMSSSAVDRSAAANCPKFPHMVVDDHVIFRGIDVNCQLTVFLFKDPRNNERVLGNKSTVSEMRSWSGNKESDAPCRPMRVLRVGKGITRVETVPGQCHIVIMEEKLPSGTGRRVRVVYTAANRSTQTRKTA